MKRGFTLIELLIVMVIVGVLVAVALPQYKRTAERGRVAVGQEALRYAADKVNAWYILHNNTYPTSEQFGEELQLSKEIGSVVNLFTYSYSPTTVTLERNGNSGWNYTLQAKLEDGRIKKISCTGTDCEELGLL